MNQAKPVQLKAEDGYFERFSKLNLIVGGAFTVIFLLWSLFLVGYRVDHLYFLGFLLLMFFLSKTTHQMLLGFFFFVLFWLIYDSMKIYPNYLANPVHIQEPYDIEKALFGIEHNGEILTPNEYVKLYPSTFLSVLSGIFYLCWVPVPLILAIMLFFKKKRRLLVEFSAAFLLTNLVGFVIYYLYPAAPPWYVELYGFEENFQIPGNVAGLAEFDRFFGIKLFDGMYAKSSNVFAAIPSLHSAYPVVLFYYGLKLKNNVLNALFLIILLGIWFAAVYSCHHYIIDVILGAFCAIFAIILFEKLILKSKIKNWIDRYSDYISS